MTRRKTDAVARGKVAVLRGKEDRDRSGGFVQKVPPVHVFLEDSRRDPSLVDSGVPLAGWHARLSAPVLVRDPGCGCDVVARNDIASRAVRARLPEGDEYEPFVIGLRWLLGFQVQSPVRPGHEACRLDLNLEQPPRGRMNGQDICMLKSVAREGSAPTVSRHDGTGPVLSRELHELGVDHVSTLALIVHEIS